MCDTEMETLVREGPTLGLQKHESEVRRLRAEFSENTAEDITGYSKSLNDGDRLLGLARQAFASAIEVPPEYPGVNVTEHAGLRLTETEVKTLVRRLSDDPGSEYKRMQVVRDLSANASPSPTHRRVMSDPAECYGKVFKAALSVHDATAVVPEAVARLLAELRKSEGNIDRIKQKIQMYVDARVKSLEAGNFAAADKAHADESTALDELVTLHLDRIALLMNADKDDELVERAKAAQDALHLETERGRAEAEALNQKIGDDMAAVDTAIQRAAEEHQADMQQTEEVVSTLHSQIAENHARQEKVFDEITKLHAELAELGAERGKMVDDLVYQEESRATRNAIYNHLNQQLVDHNKMLSDTMRRLNEVSDMLAAIDATGQQRENILREKVEAAKREAETALLHEQREHHRAFSLLYCVLGERLFAAERRAEELDAAVSAASWRVAMARSTLDHAGLDGCRAYVKQVENAHAEGCESIEVIRRKMDKIAEDAAPTEEALIAAGDEVKSPVEIVRLDLAARAEECVNQRKELLTKRSESIESQRAAAQSMRPPPVPASPPSSPSGMMPPLSRTTAGTRPEDPRDVAMRRKAKFTSRDELQSHPSPPPATSPVGTSMQTQQYSPPQQSPSQPRRSASRSPSSSPRHLDLSLKPRFQASSVVAYNVGGTSPSLTHQSHPSQYQQHAMQQQSPPQPQQQPQQHYPAPSHLASSPSTPSQRSQSLTPPMQPTRALMPGYGSPLPQRAHDVHQTGLSSSPHGGGVTRSPSPHQQPYSSLSPPRQTMPPAYAGQQPSMPTTVTSPSCESLRRRAEELRQAAEESRRRAQVHREQASAMSPRY